MKLLLLIPLIATFLILPAFAIPEFSGHDIAAAANMILKGEVISYTEEGKYRYYEIQVYEYIKNPQNKDTIVMRSLKPEFIDPIDPYNTFEKGDYVFAYLYPLDETRYYSGNFSHKIETLDSYGRYNHTPDSIPEEDHSREPHIELPQIKKKPHVPSPLQQMRNGIDKDQVSCNAGFSLIYKNQDSSPVCVKNGSIFELINRGWAENVIAYSGSAWDTAEQFLQFSPTYQFDGKKRGTGISHLVTDDSTTPNKMLLLASFTKYYEGYGDRSNQNPKPLPDYDNRAEMLLQIQGKRVLSAVINNEWDELNQKYIVDESSKYTDFRIIYQKHGGIAGKDIRFEVNSKEGYLRMADFPDDKFVPVSRQEAQLFWNAIESIEYMSKPSKSYKPNPSCADCFEYGLSVRTDDSMVESYWSDGIPVDEDLTEIANKIESTAKQFENKGTFRDVPYSNVDFSLDSTSKILEPEPIPEPVPESEPKVSNKIKWHSDISQNYTVNDKIQFQVTVTMQDLPCRDFIAEITNIDHSETIWKERGKPECTSTMLTKDFPTDNPLILEAGTYKINIELLGGGYGMFADKIVVSPNNTGGSN